MTTEREVETPDAEAEAPAPGAADAPEPEAEIPAEAEAAETDAAPNAPPRDPAPADPDADPPAKTEPRMETDAVAAAEPAGQAGAVVDAPQVARCPIPPRVRLEETEALLAHLRAVPGDAPLIVDAREVESLSTPAVLALVAAARARADGPAPLAVESPSAAFVDAFSDLGLFQDLMKMEFRA